MALKFEVCGRSSWNSKSSRTIKGNPLVYIIERDADDLFDVSRSSAALINGLTRRKFDLFTDAVAWCERREVELEGVCRDKAVSLELHTAESGSGWVYKSNLPNCRFLYMVFSTVDGLFDVNHTSVELRGPAVVEQFSSLALAKAWCEDRETLLVQQGVA